MPRPSLGIEHRNQSEKAELFLTYFCLDLVLASKQFWCSFLNAIWRSRFPGLCALKSRAQRSREELHHCIPHWPCRTPAEADGLKGRQQGQWLLCTKASPGKCVNTARFLSPSSAWERLSWVWESPFVAIAIHLSDTQGAQKHNLRNTEIWFMFAIEELEITCSFLVGLLFFSRHIQVWQSFHPLMETF